jgi:transcriptional regulator GlxA family with amidase domain
MVAAQQLNPEKAKRQVVLLACPEAQILDVAGPAEVFARTAAVLSSRRSENAGYRVRLLSTGENAITTSSGISLVSHGAIGRIHGRIDTLLVVGGPNMPSRKADPAVVEWLRRSAHRVRRIGSVCTGAFLLAEASLLKNRTATTHWQWCDDLRKRYPDTNVEPDRIFVRDENVYTSAGITAGMDLALALVEEDYGPEIALQIARELVLFLRRPGGQSQFSTILKQQAVSNKPIRDLQIWLLNNLDQPNTVETMADRVSMSPRNFARTFVRETGITPARFVERLQVDAARRRLEESGDTLDQIAVNCGFGSVHSVRRAFMRVLGTRPKDYREVFHTKRAR